MERAPHPSEGGDELMPRKQLPTPHGYDQASQPGLFELSFLSEGLASDSVWDVDRGLSSDVQTRVGVLPDLRRGVSGYVEPGLATLWAVIEVPVARPDQRARWSTALGVAIDARLSGRWGYTCLTEGHVRTCFTVETIDDQTKQELAEFVRAEASIFNVDLDVDGARVRVAAQGDLRDWAMPGGQIET